MSGTALLTIPAGRYVIDTRKKRGRYMLDTGDGLAAISDRALIGALEKATGWRPFSAFWPNLQELIIS